MKLDNKNITADSRKVTKDSIFVAIKGLVVDGHDFIENAIYNGARTIILDNQSKIIKKYKNKINFVLVDDSRIALARLLSKVYQQPKNIMAVTGTNGKTSVVNFTSQIIAALGENAASIGTMGVKDNREIFNNRQEYHNLTTPEVITLHKILDELVINNIEYVALEASSHGLHQHRLDGVNIKSAAFTNFSQDHLDYHENMDKYFAAKAILFKDLLSENSTVILNADIKEFNQLKAICKEKQHNILSYGREGSFIKIKDIFYSNGLNCQYEIGKATYELKTNLLGEFQLYNIFAAAGLSYSCGFKTSKIASVLPKLSSIPGRMQRVGNSEIFVDYSHTPDALENALKVMRHNLKGKLIVVFGCGGDRDSTKRPLMGEIARKLADIVIIADDNPRTEDPKRIRQEIIASCKKAVEIGDREKAIKYAIENMNSDDRLLIAGKGHENYQIIRKQKIDFDDNLIALKYI